MELFFSQWLVKQCAISDLLLAFWPFSALSYHSCTIASHIVVLIFLKAASGSLYIYLPVICLADIGLVHQHSADIIEHLGIHLALLASKTWRIYIPGIWSCQSLLMHSPIFQKWSQRTYLEWSRLDTVLHKNTQKSSENTPGGRGLFKEGRICSRIWFSIFFSIQFFIFNFSNSQTQIWLRKSDGG